MKKIGELKLIIYEDGDIISFKRTTTMNLPKTKMITLLKEMTSWLNYLFDVYVKLYFKKEVKEK